MNLEQIYKPKTLDEALQRLQQPGAAALAGGTQIVAEGVRVRTLVDLSELGLAYLRSQEGGVALGAMTTLQALADSPMLRAAANGIVAEAAHRSASSILRNRATLAGTLLAEPGGLLAAALVALDASVSLTFPAPVPLSQLLARPELVRGTLIMQITIPSGSLHRHATIETVARTPRDRPIVAVCAALEIKSGVIGAARVVLCGVSEIAQRADQAEQTLAGQPLTIELGQRAGAVAAEGLAPVSDYRGSAEYRREMARVLTGRALQRLAG